MRYTDARKFHQAKFPYFLGDKYGWQPIPGNNTRRGDDCTSRILKRKNKKLIENWYRLDKNAVPSENPDSHEYVLQPKWNSLEEYKDSVQVESLDLKILRDAWDPVAKQIRKILRDSVEKLDFSAEQKLYYNASATHQEIIRGALNPPEDSEPEKLYLYLPEVLTACRLIKLRMGLLIFWKTKNQMKRAKPNLLI